METSLSLPVPLCVYHKQETEGEYTCCSEAPWQLAHSADVSVSECASRVLAWSCHLLQHRHSESSLALHLHLRRACRSLRRGFTHVPPKSRPLWSLACFHLAAILPICFQPAVQFWPRSYLMETNEGRMILSLKHFLNRIIISCVESGVYLLAVYSVVIV